MGDAVAHDLSLRSSGRMMSQPDVIVVGGGLIGLLTAAELSERGARVCVIEKDDVGFEQSGRSVAAINLPGGAPNSSRPCFVSPPNNGRRSRPVGGTASISTPKAG